MTDKIIYTQENGIVAVVTPVSKEKIEIHFNKTFTEQKYLAHIYERSIPKNATKVREVKDSVFPANRKFRNAWTDRFEGEQVDIDLEKVPQIIRDKRNESLKELDKIAFEESRKPTNKLEAINIEAQRLRDIPQNPDFLSSDLVKLEALFDSCDIQLEI